MNLVIQGAALADDALRQLLQLTDARGIERLGATAWRLTGAHQQPGIAEYCDRAELDFAFVPEARRLADMRLLAIDMDSTLITIECIDEVADLAGVKAEVSTITAAAMSGELDYAQSLQRRVALLRGLEQEALARVYHERLRLSPGAEALLAAIHGAGLKTLLVSGGFSFFTDRLKARLALDYSISNELEIEGGRLSGRLTGAIVDAAAKAAKLRALRAELGIAKEATIAIGDGANDLAMMAEAGVSVAFRAKPVARSKADYALDHAGLDGVLNLFA
ncbi:MAG TPA: phosphoserine phosphatase SerB [Burkholderiales bacterium]|nr:phosphoserine phosphatase SerB [Burkholderiales bacterium]